MSFYENLQYLRKREKITQEDLAEELDVSRQSVSKWETGEAYPETEKLIALCDRFHVSMDDLMRGDLTQGPLAKNEGSETKPHEVYPDDIGFSKHMDAFSLKITAGVFMIIFGVALLLAFIAIAENVPESQVNLFAALGLVSLFLLVGVAVFLFILSGVNHSEFVKAHGEVKNYFTEDERSAFAKKFTWGVAVSVGVIIAAVTGMVVSYTVLDGFIFSSDGLKRFADIMIVAAFMAIVSFPVGALCYLGIQHSKYDSAEYNGTYGHKDEKSTKEKIKDGVQSLVMLAATAVFLLCGFVWNAWHPAWVVFPIGGLICAAIGVIFNIKK